jgi:DNA-binding CsgD family transcriptional regulator
MMSPAAELNRVADLCAQVHLSLRAADIAGGLLEPVANLLGAETASFRSFAVAENGGKPLSIVCLGIPAAVNDAYLAEYHKLDPARHVLARRLQKPLFARPPDQWSREDGTPALLERYRQEFQRYRREFLLPNNFYHHVGFCIDAPEGGALLLDFHRAARSPEFGAVERARARLVALYLHSKAGANWHRDSPQASADDNGPLSTRELEVAEAVALGFSNKEVAASLGISVRTVENHLRSIFAKLGVTTRTRLAARLRAMATRPPPPSADG